MVASSSAAARPGAFSALGQRQFALFWYSGLGQAIGLGMQQITLGHYIFATTNSAFWVGAVAFANFFPLFTLSLFAGVLGDRMDKRKLLAVSQLISGGAVLALAVLITSGLASIGLVLLTSVVAATGQALTLSTRFAMVGELADRDHLANAFALNGLSQNGMRVLGPVLAGVLISLIGDGRTMYVNASAYLLGVLPLLLLERRPPRHGANRPRVLDDLRDGLRFAGRTIDIPAIIVPGHLMVLFSLSYMHLLPVFAKDVLDRESTGLGLLSAAAGLGSVLGGLVLAKLGNFGTLDQKHRAYQTGMIVVSLALLVFALSTNFALSLVALSISGLAMIILSNTGQVMLQIVTPAEYQERVMSLWGWGASLNFLGGFPLGAAAAAFGAPAALTGSVLLGLTAQLLLFAWFNRRRAAQRAAPAAGLAAD